MSLTEKKCPSCGETRPATQFGRNRSLGDGLSFYCLACNRERNNRWYRESRRRQGKQVRDHSWVPEGFRWCPVCKQAVAHEEYTRSFRTPSGYGARCKSCHNAGNNEAYWKRAYGLTKADVAQLRAAQDDRCAICGDSEPQHLDHDHNTGGIRQLLCQRCNHGLGLFRDDPHLLQLAAFYVQGHGERQALALLQESDSDASDSASRPGEPPAGSQRRPGRARSTRATGRTSGSRSRTRHEGSSGSTHPSGGRRSTST
jgi:hypothetical protein